MSAATDQGAVSGGEQGATVGSAAGPWGAVVGGLLGAGAGAINADQTAPSLDVQTLFSTIASSGAQEQQLIAQLPANLQPLYAQYKASLGQAGTQLQGQTTQTGQNLLSQTQANYGANAPAVQATLAALKQQDYSTQPGTMNALKSQLAATGGLSRGGAANAITKATLAPAAQYSQQAANVQGTQLQSQQANVQSAVNKIAAMDDATANSLFGMSKDQATQILTSGRTDLQNQLAGMINQINTETTQNLNVQGIQSNANYQNSVAQNTANAGVVNGLANTGGALYSAIASPGTTPSTDTSSQVGGGNADLGSMFTNQ
jgi:hypothetical protein